MTLDELHFLARRLKELAEQAMTGGRDLGLAPAEGLVMADLLRHGASPINEITRRTGFVQSRISTAVSALEDRDWVKTETDARDRRRTIVDVTPEIRRNASRATSRSADGVLAELLRDLSEDETTAVIRALDTLYAAVTAPSPDARQREAA